MKTPGFVKDIDKGWKKLFKEMAEAEKLVAKIGVFDDAKPRTEGDFTNAEIAAVHEFGAPGAGVPERSFLRSTIDAKREEYLALIKKGVAGGLPARTVLNAVGMRAAADVKNRITQGEGIPPPLAQETIDRKGSTRALVDTGQMVNSITYSVGYDEGEQ